MKTMKKISKIILATLVLSVMVAPVTSFAQEKEEKKTHSCDYLYAKIIATTVIFNTCVLGICAGLGYYYRDTLWAYGLHYANNGLNYAKLEAARSLREQADKLEAQ